MVEKALLALAGLALAGGSIQGILSAVKPSGTVAEIPASNVGTPVVFDGKVHIEPAGFVVSTPGTPFGDATFISKEDIAATEKIIRNTGYGDLTSNINFFKTQGFRLASITQPRPNDPMYYEARMVR